MFFFLGLVLFFTLCCPYDQPDLYRNAETRTPKLLNRNEERVTDPEQTGSMTNKSNSVRCRSFFISTYFNRRVSRS